MLALVSFTSTIYPSLIGTWPTFLFFLSKHIDMYTNKHTCIHSSRYTLHHARTHNRWSYGNIWRSSSNAQTNVSWRAPKEPSRRLQTARQTKSISLHCVILQHFRLTLQAQGLAFFSTRVPYTHPHACFSVRVSDPIGYRPWGMRCILWNTMSMSGSVSLASDKLLYDTSCVAGRDNRCAACGSLIIVAVYHTSTYSME